MEGDSHVVGNRRGLGDLIKASPLRQHKHYDSRQHKYGRIGVPSRGQGARRARARARARASGGVARVSVSTPLRNAGPGPL